MTAPAHHAKRRVHTGGSDGLTLGNKLARTAWAIVYHAIFRWVPPPLHGVRRVILRAFGAQLRGDCHIYPSVQIWAPWNLRMEDGACLAPGVICYNVAKVALGRNARVSQHAHLCAASHDHEDRRMPLISAPITIGAGAWVCADAFVSMGVTIGRDAVIGARAVVTKDMPAGMVCVGFPCRPVRPRWRNTPE